MTLCYFALALSLPFSCIVLYAQVRGLKQDREINRRLQNASQRRNLNPSEGDMREMAQASDAIGGAL